MDAGAPQCPPDRQGLLIEPEHAGLPSAEGAALPDTDELLPNASTSGSQVFHLLFLPQSPALLALQGLGHTGFD